ncbi:MAG TPA: hypothetical protein VM096_19515 [Vicinamibacterales bacterium]|nr:hypothetical protein [Vicinamibacterales bacterium]
MMNTVVGSAIGGLVAGVVALGAAAVMRPSAAPAYGMDPRANSAYGMPVANTSALNNGATMQCQPYEEAVLRRAFVNGRELTDVTCITRNGAFAPQGAYAPQAYAQPVTYQQPAYRDDIVTRPVTRTRTPVTRTRTVSQASRSRVSEARRENKRSWGKTAMIIGGGTGAGAGIGGLIGGKKGALIGAAVGGGAATIYESTKR